MGNSLFYEESDFSFFDDEEESEELVIKSVDAFEISSEEAATRIIYCRNCKKAHRFLECPKPILH